MERCPIKEIRIRITENEIGCGDTETRKHAIHNQSTLNCPEIICNPQHQMSFFLICVFSDAVQNCLYHSEKGLSQQTLIKIISVLNMAQAVNFVSLLKKTSREDILTNGNSGISRKAQTFAKLRNLTSSKLI